MFRHENIIYIGWYLQMKAIYKMSLWAAEIPLQLRYCQLERTINQIISGPQSTMFHLGKCHQLLRSLILICILQKFELKELDSVILEFYRTFFFFTSFNTKHYKSFSSWKYFYFSARQLHHLGHRVSVQQHHDHDQPWADQDLRDLPAAPQDGHRGCSPPARLPCSRQAQAGRSRGRPLLYKVRGWWLRGGNITSNSSSLLSSNHTQFVWRFSIMLSLYWHC